MTLPGGGTRITEKYRDGRVKSVTGTAVVPQYHTYGVNADGTQWTAVHTGSSGSDSWVTNVVDMLGRTIREIRPAFGGGTLIRTNEYDSLGRLWKTTGPDKAPTLYVLPTKLTSYAVPELNLPESPLFPAL